MILKLANKITKKLVDSKIINKEFEIYKYGIAMMISYSINIVLVLSIGLLSGNIEYSILYILSFDKLREYSGGYHANTYLKCITSFAILFILYLYVLIYINFDYLFVIALLLWIVLSNQFPIEHPNKKLNSKEKHIHGKRANIRFLVSFLTAIISRNYYYFGKSICTVLILIFLLGFIQLQINKEVT